MELSKIEKELLIKNCSSLEKKALSSNPAIQHLQLNLLKLKQVSDNNKWVDSKSSVIKILQLLGAEKISDLPTNKYDFFEQEIDKLIHR